MKCLNSPVLSPYSDSSCSSIVSAPKVPTVSEPTYDKRVEKDSDAAILKEHPDSDMKLENKETEGTKEENEIYVKEEVIMDPILGRITITEATDSELREEDSLLVETPPKKEKEKALGEITLEPVSGDESDSEDEDNAKEKGEKEEEKKKAEKEDNRKDSLFQITLTPVSKKGAGKGK